MNDQARQDAQYPKREQLHEGKCFVFGIIILIVSEFPPQYIIML